MKKFDFCIGNPPYQEIQEGDNQNYAPPVYDRFLTEAYKVADVVEMIHPARFLFNAGSTPKAWNQQMLADPHLKVLLHEQDSSVLFANTDIKGGIAVTYHDPKKNFGPIGAFTAFPELGQIKDKVLSYEKVVRGTFLSLSDIIYTQCRFNLDALYEADESFRKAIGSEGRDRRFRNNAFQKVKAFTVDKASPDDVCVLGILNNKRVFRFIARKFVDFNHENLQKWKVLVPRANGSGAIGEVLSTPLIGEPLIGYTQSFIGVGSFDSEEEATASWHVRVKAAADLF